MGVQNKRIKKLCNFYVDAWHLSVMMFPYLKEKIEKEAGVITILEEQINKNLDELISKLNIKEDIKSKILNREWKINTIKFKEIEKLIAEKCNTSNDITIIVNGTPKYIEDFRESLETWAKYNKEILEKRDIKITLVDCYEVIEFNNNISKILQKHDKILNTSGEKEIEEVFDEYKVSKRDVS